MAKQPESVEKIEAQVLLPMSAKRAKRMISAVGVFLQTIAPNEWLDFGLEKWKDKGLTVEEVIALRQVYCLSSNARFQNADLLKEIYSRIDGKVKLTVEHTRPGDAAIDEELDGLSDEELRKNIRGMLRALELRDRTPKLEGQVTDVGVDGAGEELKEAPDRA